MPPRTDIHHIFIIGSGPIVIGQGCEFDYSGSQACRALKADGYEVTLVNSNPATIMTDPDVATRTYVEPLTLETVTRILEIERPDVLLPTMGGQTGLNLGADLAREGVLDRLKIEMVGAKRDVIERAEDRSLFKKCVESIGLQVPASGYARSEAEAHAVGETLGYPLIIRPSFTLGGTGGGVAYNREEFHDAVQRGLRESPRHEILIEESLLGWKEFELEVMRDSADNASIICTIENFDPMGIHTGDSITVAPAQTLTDRELQSLRDGSLALIRAVGVETGGSNIQFAINPRNGDLRVIEMNPRVSRSSALASKATGFPIAKIAARLAVGWTLNEIRNEVTGETPACFEPALDYVVVKMPRFNFDKFPGARQTLGLEMRSVGEVMAIGRTFREALGKAVRSLETGTDGLDLPPKNIPDGLSEEERRSFLESQLVEATPDRLWWLAEALRQDFSVEECAEASRIDPWFVDQVAQMVMLEKKISLSADSLDEDLLRKAKRSGLSDATIGRLSHRDEKEVRELRRRLNVWPVFKRVDTCAGEFEAITPYFYSSYEEETEVRDVDDRSILILGSGPNRIGQGLEFDHGCVHASLALKKLGVRSIMVNSNPSTVSTDYDVSDHLYFEPITIEDVLPIIEAERPEGVIVQFGGQTALKLAGALAEAGIPILGTPPEVIDLTEDRGRFQVWMESMGLLQPESGAALTVEEAIALAKAIGYPLIVRPSYVLGGRAMRIVYEEDELLAYLQEAWRAGAGRAVLIDRFLEAAIELEADAISDGESTIVVGVMELIEEAGVHSGDSAAALPPHSVSPDIVETVKDLVRTLSRALGIVGLMNMQFAVKDGQVYVLEVNARASRTVPFVSKTVGLLVAQLATRAMMGIPLAESGLTADPEVKHVAVKEAVMPFRRFRDVDTLLGPEMKSTGEVMGVDLDFPTAYVKAQLGAGMALPHSGRAFLSVRNEDKPALVALAEELHRMDFSILATKGTAGAIRAVGLPVERILKVREGGPNIVDRMINGDVQIVINTSLGRSTVRDAYWVRRAAVDLGIPYTTTIAGASALVRGIQRLKERPLVPQYLQAFLKEQARLQGTA